MLTEVVRQGRFENEIQDSISYLQSDLAIEIVKADAYWPKWNSPWWHMLLLHEMGETQNIPEKIVETYIQSLIQLPLKIFPIHPGEMPDGLDPYRGSPCHCQLGNVYQVLAARGVDVDQELPWIRPWFLRYQLADGGLNCDNEAYLVKNETPSSMVGTIAAFEAILLYTRRPWTAQEADFLKRGADFLLQRKLMLGSNTSYNASEQQSATQWVKLCFPRFYLYDVLRGLHAILKWSEMTQSKIPYQNIQDVMENLMTQFPDGQIRIGRKSYEGVETILQTNGGQWIRRQPASLFPLLQKVSEVGTVSPFLTRQWQAAQTLAAQSQISVGS